MTPPEPHDRRRHVHAASQTQVDLPVTGDLLIALTLAAGGLAYAAIPAADGTIRGCYATTDGLLGIPHSKGDTRIIDQGEVCRSYEKPITWNQDGSAVAYVTVTFTGAVLADQSKNITSANVKKGSAGTYCITGLPFTVRSAVVSAGLNIFDVQQPDVVATSYVAPGTVGGVDGCAAKVIVKTYDISSGSLQDRPFTIWLED